MSYWKMFYHIMGELCHIETGFAVIDCGGVGYKLSVSTNTSAALERATETEKKKIKLYTHMVVREDLVDLYGFYSYEELSAFRLLITVSGVGPRAATSILSTMSPEVFALAVCTENTKQLSKSPGVGAKTAARIVLELKDKLSKENSGVKLASADGSQLFDNLSANERGKLAEAQDALSVLGYGRAEINAALSGIDTSSLELEEIIRMALKKFMKG